MQPEPAEESLTATVTFPGPILRGDAGDAAPSSRATLPTVLDLSRSGDRIPLAAISAASGGYGDPEFEDPAGDPTPDSTQLIFSQFVVHAPGGVYSTFEADGIPDIADSIDFGVGSRFCLINRYAPRAPVVHQNASALCPSIATRGPLCNLTRLPRWTNFPARCLCVERLCCVCIRAL